MKQKKLTITENSIWKIEIIILNISNKFKKLINLTNSKYI